MDRRTSPLPYAFSLVLALCWIFPTVASAETPTEEGLRRLADAVSKVLKDNSTDEVSVADFFGSFLPQATGGVALKQQVTNALIKAGIKVSNTAKYQLQGRFAISDASANDEAFESIALRITASIVDRNDNVQKIISIPVFGDDALQFVGATGDIPPTSSNPNDIAERESLKRESIRNAKVALVGSEVRTRDDSPFGIEILVSRGSNREKRMPEKRQEDHVGQMAFVPLTDGEEYIIRLHNRSDEETAVDLTVDGLSIFAFANENPGGLVIVKNDSFVDIPGWVITESKTDVFEVSSYAKSVAASIGKPITTVGTITASFFKSSIDATGKDPLATMRGREIEKKYIRVSRIIGDMKAVISVRYDRGK